MFIPVIRHRAGPALMLALALVPSAPLVLSAAAAPPATATATVTYHSRLAYTAAAGQANTATVSMSNGPEFTLVYVIDDVVPITVGDGCTHPDSSDLTRVLCLFDATDPPSPYASGVIDLGDKNDSITFINNTDQTFFYNEIFLGTGNDTSVNTGSLDAGRVGGGAGNDSITVGSYGGGWGESGNDDVFASGQSARADGGEGDDVLQGATSSQFLDGGAGNDLVRGGTGGDILSGGKGNDTLYGNSGADIIYGNTGNDKLYGGPGHDRLSGGAGRDIVHQ